jgi:hypothetical protein
MMTRLTRVPGRTPTAEPPVERGPREAPLGGLSVPAVIALQRTAGNAAVVATLARKSGPLSDADADAAWADYRGGPFRFDQNCDRIILSVLRQGGDAFLPASAQALARFQDRAGLVADGKIDVLTLDALARDLVRNNRHAQVIHLVNLFFSTLALDESLTIRYNAALQTDSTTKTEAGELFVVEVGPSAFIDVTTLADVLRVATQRAGVILGPLGLPVPSLLSPAQERDAITFNNARFPNMKAMIAIQGLLSGGKAFATSIDAQTVQLIADVQRVSNIPVSGIIDDDTLREFITRLIAAGQHNAALLLIAEGHSAIDTSGLLDFSADLSLPGDYELDAPGLTGPTSVRFGQETFKQDFAGITHTVAHAATEAKLLQNGVTSQEVRGFFGARTEILSIGMEEEGFGAGATGKALFGTGFIQDAEDALYNFKNMTVRERKRFFRAFEEVRDKVDMRFLATTAANRKTYAKVLDGYRAVQKPK